MAEKLLLYYKHMKDTLGFKGQMDLAIITKMPSAIAAMEPDNLENIQLFKSSILRLTGKPAPDF